MFKLKITLCFISVFILNTNLLAQSKNTDQILNKVKANLNDIKTYEVDVELKVNLNFLKIPSKKGKIYFKAPNKFKFDAKGFAMLPKQAFVFTPDKLFPNEFKFEQLKDDTLNGKTCKVLVGKSESDSVRIKTSKIWVNSENFTIMQIVNETRVGVNYQIVVDYNKIDDFNLPKKIKLIISSTNELNTEDRRRNWRVPSEITGTVIVTYSNYKVNKNMDETIFEKKN